MGGPTDEREALLFDPHRGLEALSADAREKNVLAVLTESTSDEWHRRWERTTGGVHEQMGLVEMYDFARSTAAAEPTTRVVDADLAVTTMQRPLEADAFARVVERYLDGWADSAAETVLYVESLDALVDDFGVRTLLDATERILDAAEAVGATVRVGYADEDAPAVATVRLCELFDDVVGAPLPDADAVGALQRLRDDDPTNFGYFRRHWRDTLRALEASTRTYPQAKQLHADADVSDTSPRTLGASLSALERLDALALWGDTIGANRYDLTRYDAERAAALGLAAESLPE